MSRLLGFCACLFVAATSGAQVEFRELVPEDSAASAKLKADLLMLQTESPDKVVFVERRLGLLSYSQGDYKDAERLFTKVLEASAAPAYDRAVAKLYLFRTYRATQRDDELKRTLASPASFLDGLSKAERATNALASEMIEEMDVAAWSAGRAYEAGRYLDVSAQQADDILVSMLMAKVGSSDGPSRKEWRKAAERWVVDRPDAPQTIFVALHLATSGAGSTLLDSKKLETMLRDFPVHDNKWGIHAVYELVQAHHKENHLKEAVAAADQFAAIQDGLPVGDRMSAELAANMLHIKTLCQTELGMKNEAVKKVRAAHSRYAGTKSEAALRAWSAKTLPPATNAGALVVIAGGVAVLGAGLFLIARKSAAR